MPNQNLESLEENIFDFLFSLRRKPGMYFGEKSLTRLHVFLAGYQCGLARAGKTLRGEDQFHLFHDWVAARLGFTSSTSGWCKMIQSTSENDEKAFHSFYELLDHFCRENSIAR